MAAGDVTRRASITAPSMHRRPSARRGSLIKNPQTQSQVIKAILKQIICVIKNKVCNKSIEIGQQGDLKEVEY